jgi:hypothetical protein
MRKGSGRRGCGLAMRCWRNRCVWPGPFSIMGFGIIILGRVPISIVFFRMELSSSVIKS